MPNAVFNWTFGDIEKFLKEHGFRLTHTRGSHHYYVGVVEKQIRQVCVPYHGRQILKPRTLKGIILQSGIPQKDWLA